MDLAANYSQTLRLQRTRSSQKEKENYEEENLILEM